MVGAVMNDVDREKQIRQTLIDIASLLDGVAEYHWAKKARNAASTSTIDLHEVLSWYGGMGSINDLVIARVNGHRVERAQEVPLNDKLDELRNKVYVTASALRRR
jgi:hypothetical protein